MTMCFSNIKGEYSETSFSQPQLNVADEIFQIFTNKLVTVIATVAAVSSMIPGSNMFLFIRQVVLVSLFQAGKSEAYLLLGCLMIYKKKVKYVVVMSGMTDLDLKNQTIRNKAKVISKFRCLLLEEMKYNDDLKTVEDVDMIIDELKHNIRIVWGNELNHYDGPTYNTLFINDESHYAQDKEMKVDKFCMKHKIDFGGKKNLEEMERRNVFTLSVSATPYSEICNVYHAKQHKTIVFMKPGIGYHSLGDLHRNNQLRWFDAKNPKPTYRYCLDEMLKKSANGRNTYMIARVPTSKVLKKESNLDLKKMIQEEFGCMFDVWEYDSVTKKCKDSAMKSFDDLEKEPLKPTVILIKGMGRCGNNIPQKHILFGIETSFDPNSDTILQALIGRFLGYHDNTELVIFVTKEFYDSGEIEKAIAFFEGDISQIPIYARNVIPKRECVKQKETARVNVENEKGMPIMPIRLLNVHPMTVDILLSKMKENIQQRAPLIHRWLQDMDYDTQNGEEVMEELLEQLNRENVFIQVSKVSSSLSVSKKVPPKIVEANETGVAKALGSGKGSLYGEFTLHVFVDDSFADLGFHKGDVYLDGRTKKTFVSDMSRILPRTTGRELFSRQTFD